MRDLGVCMGMVRRITPVLLDSARQPGYTQENYDEARKAFKGYKAARDEYRNAEADQGPHSRFRKLNAADSLKEHSAAVSTSYRKIGGDAFNKLASDVDFDVTAFNARQHRNHNADVHESDTDTESDREDDE